MSEQSEIHDMTFSEASDKRIKAAKQLRVSFNVFTDRRQALDDQLSLCSDEDSAVREKSINSLAVVFPDNHDEETFGVNFPRLIRAQDEYQGRSIQCARACVSPS